MESAGTVPDVQCARVRSGFRLFVSPSVKQNSVRACQLPGPLAGEDTEMNENLLALTRLPK